MPIHVFIDVCVSLGQLHSEDGLFRKVGFQVVKRCMQLVDVVAAEVAAGFDCLDHEWLPKRAELNRLNHCGCKTSDTKNIQKNALFAWKLDIFL